MQKHGRGSWDQIEPTHPHNFDRSIKINWTALSFQAQTDRQTAATKCAHRNCIGMQNNLHPFCSMPSSNSLEASSGLENIRKQFPRPRRYIISSYLGTVRSTSFSSSSTSSSTSSPLSALSDNDPQHLNTTVVPEKNRTKRLLLITIALFPPFTLVMVILLPFILLIAGITIKTFWRTSRVVSSFSLMINT